MGYVVDFIFGITLTYMGFSIITPQYWILVGIYVASNLIRMSEK